MGLKSFLGALGCFTLVVGTATLNLIPQATQAQSVSKDSRFFCSSNYDPQLGQTVPSTIVQTSKRKVSIISWQSQWASASGFTPQRRCEEVSARFQRYYDAKQLGYMRTGRINGYPVICIASVQGGQCDLKDVLVTLKWGEDPQWTLEQFVAIRTLDRNTPVPLSNDLIFYRDGEAYIDMEAFLNQLSKTEPERSTNGSSEIAW